MSYFNANALPEPHDEHVAWVDVMGCQSHMARSIKVVANFVFKLHVAAIEARQEDVTVYPVMDGFYAMAIEAKALQCFLRGVFSDIAALFRGENQNHFRFVIREAVSFGGIYHGRDIGEEGAKRLEENPTYKSSICLGMPIIDAYKTEQQAPPFGLAVHPSATSFIEMSQDGVWWPWFDAEFNAAEFSTALSTYYAWCRRKSTDLRYDVARIIIHDALAQKYFARGYPGDGANGEPSNA